MIDRLPEERKKIMLMSLEGKSGEEIACDLNITIHTVKQQKYRAYKFLREQLGQYTSLLFIFFFR
ncbi:MAG: sigma-70 region 4 domain-containing protein [Odoribacter splanchnicus]|uniref:sigma-70 region 4 domain-containing protein n=1 Tax=Odoribacter splanchnicus TaxID=28118 RepID=UPI0021CE90EB|nr:sigma-70 region 4 domain-containing protein [Odoribacter splanchnicus]MDB9203719.1 sigma-70 region 4 domain-containing protein [Odoribacter splanchnicus]